MRKILYLYLALVVVVCEEEGSGTWDELYPSLLKRLSLLDPNIVLSNSIKERRSLSTDAVKGACM